MVDAGMNFGFVSTIAAHAVGKSGQVHSFDPMPGCIEAMRQTIRANGLTQVTLHPVALGAESGTLEVNPDPRGPAVQVPVTTLDEELGHLDRLDLLKVDVDGPDLEVLEGARGLIARHNPVIIVEVQSRFAEFRSFLESAGYRHFIDTANDPIVWDGPPINVVASTTRLQVPERGQLPSVPGPYSPAQ